MTKAKKKFSALEQRDTSLQEIRRAIIIGRYAPGFKLIEAALCEDFAIKRSRVREILQILAQEGFVKSVPYVGCFVSEISPKDIAQIYDLLGVLEGLAVRVATPLLNNEEIEHLETMVYAIREADGNPDEMFKRNREFHVNLTESSNNARLENFAGLLRQHNRRISLSFFYEKSNTDHSFEQHIDIIDSIRSRDGQLAEHKIRSHYIDARDALLKALHCCV